MKKIIIYSLFIVSLALLLTPVFTNAQTSCMPHAYKQCFFSQIYWYDSCNNRQELFQDCGYNYSTYQFRCSGNVLQREDFFNSCQDSTCIQSHQWTNYTDCSLYNEACQNNQCVSLGDFSCSASPNPAQVGQTVTFASYTGGVTGYISCSWSGACSGSGTNCQTTFSQPGEKVARVNMTLESGQNKIITCSVSISQEPCECFSGPCCDGCHYKNAYTICNTETQTEYGCPQGSACGSDVGARTKTRNQYCSGNNSQCTGNWSNWTGLSDWRIVDYCSTAKTCIYGNQRCQASAGCPIISQRGGYILHYLKGCLNDDLYWYDSQNIRQEKYQECQDNNSCTQDVCSNSKCSNELVCDGTTCGKDSADYCNSCNHCGDGVCSCEEATSSCQQDCQIKETIGKEGFLAGLLNINLNRPLYILLGIIIAIFILMAIRRMSQGLRGK